MLMALIRTHLFAGDLADRISVESAGVNAGSAGQPAAPEAIEVMSRRGLCLHNHKSRYIGEIGDLTRFDSIYCVSREISAAVIAALPPEGNKNQRVWILGDDPAGIPNPWKKGLEEYELCALELEGIARRVADGLEFDLLLSQGAA